MAPCLHHGPCGLLADGNAMHWCHQFAAVPGGVFTDPGWSRFARITGIDLSSLPVSYLVLDRRPPKPPPQDALRVLGRARVYKAHALVQVCDASGVREVQVAKRGLPEVFRACRKHDLPSVACWRIEQGHVVGEPAPGEA